MFFILNFSFVFMCGSYFVISVFVFHVHVLFGLFFMFVQLVQFMFCAFSFRFCDFYCFCAYIYPSPGFSSPYRQKTCFLFCDEHCRNKTKGIIYL